MSKLKSVKSAMKRFKKTAHGFKRKQSFRRHILTKKSTQRKRHLRAESYVCKADIGLVAAMLPN